MISKATSVERVKEIGSPCNKCGHCCKFSSGFLVDEDINNIAEFLKIDKEIFILTYLEEKELFNTKIFRPVLLREDKPYGQCIFFDKIEGCKIHEVKPLFCKIANCFAYSQDLIAWFYLNYLVNKDDPESIRQYASYLESGGKLIPGGQLHELVPDKERLNKILSYEELF